MENRTSDTTAPQRLHSEKEPAARPPVLTSSELLQGGRFVEIRHNGEVYRLQATRLGKLILTK
ncbi:MAG: hemP [Ramlibacter sp.]|jgi:hemin uptake protein HemP|nr:hemP [Ramlibacter sp.]